MINTKRELWADLLRIFAIFGVVSLHTINIHDSLISPYIYKIFETSVPLFVMLSGALLLGKTESYGVFFIKRTTKVLIPWICWTLIYVLFYFILKDNYVISNYFSLGDNQLNSWVRFFFIQFFTGLWFLPLIFGIYILTPPIRIFVKSAENLDLIYILFLWFLFISFLPWIFSNSLFPEWIPSFIYAPIQYSGYFILGYVLYKKLIIKKSLFSFWYIIPIIALIFLLPISNFLEPSTVLASVLLFIYIYSFAKLIEPRINLKFNKIIINVSNACLGIYITHTVITYLINIYFKIDLFSGYSIIYTFFIFTISFLLVYMLQRIPIIKFIVS